MRIATWNLNNKVGKTKFHPEAADAVVALNPDVIVFTEFFPQSHETAFCRTLKDAGWQHQLVSPTPAEEIANRVLIAAKERLEPLDVALPNFDLQFPANLLGAYLPGVGITLVGVRVPAYVTTKTAKATPLYLAAWDWLEQMAARLRNTPSIMLGDLNVSLSGPRAKGGDHFRRILADGWHCASPSGDGSYFGSNGIRTKIDHIIGTCHCKFSEAEYVQKKDGFVFGDAPKSKAISDHAALVCRVSL